MIETFANHLSQSQHLENYFYDQVPQVIWETIDFKTEPAYFALHLECLSKKVITLNDTHWYIKDPYTNLPHRKIFENESSIFYEVSVRIKKRTKDIIGIIKATPNDDRFMNYICYLSEITGVQFTSGMFSYCDSGFTMPAHKDAVPPSHKNHQVLQVLEEKSKTRTHHVVSPGDSASLILFDDKKNEIDRLYAKRGDVFRFNAVAYLHSFEAPVNSRLHLILSSP